MAWAPRASELMPNYKGASRSRASAIIPTRLSYFRNTDCIVCNTPGIAERVRGLGWKREIRVISNFTGTGRVEAIDRAMLDTPADAPVVMSMGRFVERKGFHTLIEAVARLPGIYLWLLGDGEERDNLHKLATDLGVSSRVRFAGWQEDTRPFLAAADVFVMSSSHEPLGNVILESWAQGTPVVSTRSEGPQWFMPRRRKRPDGRYRRCRRFRPRHRADRGRQFPEHALASADTRRLSSVLKGSRSLTPICKLFARSRSQISASGFRKPLRSRAFLLDGEVFRRVRARPLAPARQAAACRP